jgi:hypothetical protein
MIRMTLTDDAPEVETIDGEGFVRIETMTTADEEDLVIFRANGTDDKPVAIPIAASATQRTTIRTPTSSQAVEMRVRERDLTGYGHYRIQCFTRRKQPRLYEFSLVKGETDDTISIVLDPTPTPCSWVTAEDVYQSSKTDKVTIPAQL